MTNEKILTARHHLTGLALLLCFSSLLASCNSTNYEKAKLDKVTVNQTDEGYTPRPVADECQEQTDGVYRCLNEDLKKILQDLRLEKTAFLIAVDREGRATEFIDWERDENGDLKPIIKFPINKIDLKEIDEFSVSGTTVIYEDTKDPCCRSHGNKCIPIPCN